jgi:electron transport complex protein RnfE
MMKNKSKIFLNGLIYENPVFVMMIGMCPAIAITTNIQDAICMGLSVIFVLFFSNLIISCIKKIVPNEIRIPVYIVIIASLVTVVKLILKAYFAEIDEALGVFISLIVVNCLILGRAESFASKNNPIDSMIDALGMGLGFTVSIIIIAAIRQGLSKFMPVFATTVGGFLILGLILGVIQSAKNVFIDKKPTKLKKEGAK